MVSEWKSLEETIAMRDALDLGETEENSLSPDDKESPAMQRRN